MPSASLFTPVGPVTVTEAAGEITRLDWRGGHAGRSETLDAALAQLAGYFAGTRETFDLPLAFGSGFQADFLRALTGIPFGRTRTYGDLARDLGVRAQAIGQACGANRIPILIPCHRVLAQCGLGGYSGAGGIETKVALLRHESAASLLI
ncbi:MAG: methylated-DNA--[protein]-cysteine S-methyltransferase [Paracoccaceae bacterium]